MRLRALGFAAALAFAFGGASLAQDANAIKTQNWDRIATAMVHALAQSRGIQMQSPVFGGLSDLNFDSSSELFAFTDPSNCIPAECGTTIFELQGKDFNEALDVSDEVKHTPVNQITFPAQKRNSHVDVNFGQTVLTFNGTRYVEASTMPRGAFNAKMLQAACVKDGEIDYQFENKGVKKSEGRKKICACMADRFVALGFDQAAADKAIDRFKRNSDDDPENDDSSGGVNGMGPDEVGDARTACLVQNGWSQWSATLGSGDETAAQMPLDYSQFIANCAGQDWLASNAKIGSADRTLSLCGCVARRLSARGWDQPSLDGVGQLYASQIDEDALTAIRSDATDIADNDLDACFGELPKL